MKVIPQSQVEEILQTVDFRAGQNYGERHAEASKTAADVPQLCGSRSLKHRLTVVAAVIKREDTLKRNLIAAGTIGEEGKKSN